MNTKPQKDDLAALEEYYRNKLLEYSKRSALKQPEKTNTEIPPQQVEMNPKPTPKTQEEKTQSAVLVPEKEAKDYQQIADSLHFTQKKTPSFPTAERSRVLQPQTAVLRTASMVSAQPMSDGKGYIRVHVTTASGAIPIADADVIITSAEGDRVGFIEHLVTDASGNTPLSMPLPTVSASLSQTPSAAVRPYTFYQVQVKASGFSDYVAKQIPVFDGEASVIEAMMLPLGESWEVQRG